MNLHEILAMLRSERDRLERTIKALEQLEQQPKSGRGRGSMGEQSERPYQSECGAIGKPGGSASAKTLRSFAACAGPVHRGAFAGPVSAAR